MTKAEDEESGTITWTTGEILSKEQKALIKGIEASQIIYIFIRNISTYSYTIYII